MLAVLIPLCLCSGCGSTPAAGAGGTGVQFAVYFNNDGLSGGATACDAVFPVARTSAATVPVAGVALDALFLGPTPAERSQGYRSFFSQRTAQLLKRARVVSGTAYVDLHDLRRELSGATSSCGSAEFFSQIRHTLQQFTGVERVIFAIEGQPRVFYDWMELECGQRNDNCDPGPFASP